MSLQEVFAAEYAAQVERRHIIEIGRCESHNSSSSAIKSCAPFYLHRAVRVEDSLADGQLIHVVQRPSQALQDMARN